MCRTSRAKPRSPISGRTTAPTSAARRARLMWCRSPMRAAASRWLRRARTSTATSTPTSAVVDQAATLSVTVSGTAQEGQTLTASYVSDEPSETTVTYQWQNNGANISGATGSTYVVQESDEGGSIQVVATGTDLDGNPVTTTATSTPTSAVVDQAATLSVTVSGTAQEGQTLTASYVSDEPSETTVTYQWQNNGANISGATGSTYVVQESDEGGSIQVVATGTDLDGNPVTTTATSTPTSAVVDQAATLSVTVSGTAQEGQTLTASYVSDEPSETTVTYQWQNNGANISGATGSTYVVQESDEGGSIQVVATG